MLDEKDLQAIAGLIYNVLDEKINASEARMKAHVEKAINASEACMLARMEPRAQESEACMLSMMEACFEPRFNLLGEHPADSGKADALRRPGKPGRRCRSGGKAALPGN